MSTLDIDRLIDQFFKLDALRKPDEEREGDSIQRDSVDRIEPQYAGGWPAGLNAKVRAAAEKIGIERLYQHQYDAIEESLSGSDVVLESPTASGKTLAFTLPMLHALKEEPKTHALMIYPMKALALDQLLQLWELTAPLGLDAYTYDGDTDSNERAKLSKNPPHILLTNPEYLNRSFLAYQDKWKKFLLRLKYVVIDEMHLYRGYFGCNMALLLRRFFCYLKRLGVSPRVFLSTATCENPQEHAENLLGRKVELVPARDSFRPKRHFVFVKPEYTEKNYRKMLRDRVVNAAQVAMIENLQTIIFCPTIRLLERAARDCKKRAKEMGMDPERVAPYHGSMVPKDRREIQRKIEDGEIDVVFATNALEVGVDIGKLDGIVLAGFPPSVMSAWQQIGRAGRSWDKDAFVLLYATNDPIDQLFVGNLNAFLTKEFDRLVINSDNQEIMSAHIPSLMHEVDGPDGLRMSDMAVLGEPFYKKAKKDGGYVRRFPVPQRNINLRSYGKLYLLRHNGEKIGQISEMRKFREAYIGAIFTFFGKDYRVVGHEIRNERNKPSSVVLEEYPHQHHITEPRYHVFSRRNELFKGSRFQGSIGSSDESFDVYFGSLNIHINFTGYKLVNERTFEVIDTVDSRDAHYINHLRFFSIDLPTGDASTGGVGALEHLIRVGAMFKIPADRFDASTYSTAGGNQEETPTAYYYENYPGGIGIANDLFEGWTAALQKGIEIAENCDCPKGCPNCIVPARSYDIGRAPIDKVKGIQLAKALLAAAKNGPTHTLENGMMRPVRSS